MPITGHKNIKIVVSLALINDADEILLSKRPKNKHLGGFWEFPGGKVETDELPEIALIREIKEELGIDVVVISDPSNKIQIKYPKQISTPITIMIEDIQDPLEGFHQHIDMIYACKPKVDISDAFDGWIWVGIEDLVKEKSFITPEGDLISPPEDVKVLGKRSLDLVRKFG